MSESPKFQPFSAPKGVPDYVPPVSPEFLAVREAFTRQTRLAGYEHIELPVFEETGLFARGVGESTDVVSKEMYTFEDRGGRSVTLRPEGTAGVMRAVIEHNLDWGQLPVKLSYAGPFFRYERPQAGRYRQLQQVGVEAIGADDPVLDAETVALADRCFRSIGLTGFRLEMTSLGDGACRPAYRAKLQDFLLGLPLDEATRERARINPLRVLDDKRAEVKEMTADAPLMPDHLCADCRGHFETVTGLLDDMGVAYTPAPRLVRGLDYYTRTCFEFVHDGLGAQSGIGGGGRYDGLMAQLGGQELSGIGFGLGVDRALLALRAEELTVCDGARVAVYGVAMGEAARRRMAVEVDRLRVAGISADMSFGERGLKGAMKGADRAGARFALVLGDRELESGTVAVKDLAAHEQIDVPIEDLVVHLQGRLSI
ncbi:histidine--tRNA ligase [Corynebacterium sp. P7003]|uniref:Histidine--tRNA ligase n=1 Tax=Corynebacterium pygosceleis TaxID=2800406 RepID=A0ABT3WNN3_9CORY|nr:histidine--tRNA ligase [Corynebacterium pygosceleis]MCX7443835.1 histidine--tRNA ligase [Corynebacterium pygosceleis]